MFVHNASLTGAAHKPAQRPNILKGNKNSLCSGLGNLLENIQMSKIKIHGDLVVEKVKRDSRPPMEGTLMRVDCELGNLLENSLLPLHPDDRYGLEDLKGQVMAALGECEYILPKDR